MSILSLFPFHPSTVYSHVDPELLCLQFVNPEMPGYVGFANLPNQVHRKSVKKGFEFTLMVVGKSPKSHFLFLSLLSIVLSDDINVELCPCLSPLVIGKSDLSDKAFVITEDSRCRSIQKPDYETEL